MFEHKQLKRIIEGLIMANGEEPLTVRKLLQILNAEFSASAENDGKQLNLDASIIQKIVEELRQDYQDRSIELKEVASGYRFQICADLSYWIAKLWQEKSPRYSKVLLDQKNF